jgi:DnaJ domain
VRTVDHCTSFAGSGNISGQGRREHAAQAHRDRAQVQDKRHPALLRDPWRKTHSGSGRDSEFLQVCHHLWYNSSPAANVKSSYTSTLQLNANARSSTIARMQNWQKIYSCLAARRQFALRFHPDKATDAPQKAAAEVLFQLVSEAHSVLSDAESRRQYDISVLRRKYRGASNAPGPRQHYPS